MQHSRRDFIKRSAAMAGLTATGVGTFSLKPAWAAEDTIKVGIALDMTGPVAALGLAGVNTAKMVAEDMNAAGGIMGRPVELVIADTASNEAIGVANVRTLMQRDRPEVVIGGISSAMRNAIKDTIIGRGRSLYIYPMVYEGQECTSNLYCTGVTPAQQCTRFIPWLMENGGKKFALPSSNYIWPQVMNDYVRNVVTENGGEIVYEEYFPFDQVDFSSAASKILNTGADVVINNVIPPGAGSLIKNLHQAGFNTTRGGRFASFYYDENALNFNTAEELEGLASSLEWFQDLAETDQISGEVLGRYREMFPGPIDFTAGNAGVGVYRAMHLWAKAVEQVGTTKRDDVVPAIDTVSVDSPGGTASFVPGKRHCQMPMYIAVSHAGKFEVVDATDGPVDPQEC